MKKPVTLFSTILLIILVLGTIYFKPVILKTSEISSYLYGSRLVTERNIPYAWHSLDFWNGYSFVLSQHYKLPTIRNIESEQEIGELFAYLTTLEYNAFQQNPNKIMEQGGDCQAYSIYLHSALRSASIECGYRPLPDHVYVWAILGGVPYKLDVTTKEFHLLSGTDILYLMEIIGEKDWMK